jgi:hypothetical protein
MRQPLASQAKISVLCDLMPHVDYVAIPEGGPQGRCSESDIVADKCGFYAASYQNASAKAAAMEALYSGLNKKHVSLRTGRFAIGWRGGNSMRMDDFPYAVWEWIEN